ncbi:DUF1223 domain-containing protein [Sphingopyxis indica]|uniref:DUF1223 domain-containing protein n=1 Tax=Sphingopyxis indica TaxID=436663 RepID=A0A239ECH2_9SPHN|nr:DUF1223 domain-containing protein [Sphingopyxis indica]SNS41644.1 Protein of unknown function [Sphingopyxis indica]
MKILLGLGGVVGLVAAMLVFGFPNRAPAASHVENALAQPVLVELFTSQGCSSCPPADRLLARLDGEDGVVAVSRPVTYWDRLGWKDTLARSGNDRLQRDYAARGIPGSGVYTPEAVVQGAAAAVGSDESALRDLIAGSRKDKAIALAQQGAEVVASRARANVELRFLAIASHSMVDIAKGENRGRRIGYTNVVLAEQLAPCDPSLACRAPIPAGIAGRKGADRWAAILQDRDGGTVRAVRWIRPAA